MGATIKIIRWSRPWTEFKVLGGLINFIKKFYEG